MRYARLYAWGMLVVGVAVIAYDIAVAAWWAAAIVALVVAWHVWVWRRELLGRKSWTDEMHERMDALETAHAGLCQLQADKDNLLEALEGIVTYHLCNDDGTIDHWDVTANRYACNVLVRYLPERWRTTEGGIERVTP